MQTSTEGEAVETEPGRNRRLIHTDNLMVVVWDFGGGPWDKPDPPHTHSHEQIAYIVKGDLLFYLGDDIQRLHAGDMVAIPPEVPHSIQLISAEVRLIDAFTPIRHEFL